MIVFDVDDTVYLEREYVKSGFRAAGNWAEVNYGLEGFSELAWRLFANGKRGYVFDCVLQALLGRPSARLIEELVGVYREHAPEIELLPDARRLIEQLVGLGVPIAIITDGPSPSQHNKVRALGLDSVASPIVVTADLGAGKSKPHPAAFEEVERNASSGLCYIADNPRKDFVQPLARGWKALRVRRSGGLHADIPMHGTAVREVRSLDGQDLLPWLLA